MIWGYCMKFKQEVGDSLSVWVLELQIVLKKIKIKRMKYALEWNVSQQSLKFVLESWIATSDLNFTRR